MEFTKEYLQEKTHEELVEITLKLQKQLEVAESWWKHHAKRETALFEKLHGIELSKE